MAESLNNWSEIASYLGKSVKTVQRWEAKLGLPVRRLHPRVHNRVLAFPAELDSWLLKRLALPVPPPALTYDEQRQRTKKLIAITLRETERARQNAANLVEKFGRQKPTKDLGPGNARSGKH